MKRKVLLMLLTFALILVMAPVSVNAEESINYGGLIYITIDDTTCQADYAPDTQAYYEIPETVTFGSGKTYTVTKIRWIQCLNVRYVVVPETVTSFGDLALGYYWGSGGQLCRASNFIVYGYRGSAVQNYCTQEDVRFAAILREGESPEFKAELGCDKTVYLEDGQAVLTAKAFLAEYDYNHIDRPQLESTWSKRNEAGEYVPIETYAPYDSDTASSTFTADSPGEYRCTLTETGTDPAVTASVDFTVKNHDPRPVSVVYQSAVSQLMVFEDEAQTQEYDDQGVPYYDIHEPYLLNNGDVITVSFNDGSSESYSYSSKKDDFVDSEGNEGKFSYYETEWVDPPEQFIPGSSYKAGVKIRFAGILDNSYTYITLEADPVDVLIKTRPAKVVDGILYAQAEVYEDNAMVRGAGTVLGEKAEILSKVTLDDGNEYDVAIIEYYALSDPAYVSGLKEITIPASVKEIWSNGVGYIDNGNYNFSKVEGFTISGNIGSEAQRYANREGFKFVALDPYDFAATCTVTLEEEGPFTYDGTAHTPAVTVKRGYLKLTKDTDYTLEYADNVGPGTGKVIVTGIGLYAGTIVKEFSIVKAEEPADPGSGTEVVPVPEQGSGVPSVEPAAEPVAEKAANTMTVKAKTATVKYSAVKKKAQTLLLSKVLTVKNAKGTVTYVKSSGNKNITINKSNGKVTVKKGLGKGTYKIKVKVKAAGNSKYKSMTKTVTFVIKVK